MGIGEILDRSAIAPRASASSKRGALHLAADIAARRLGLDASAVADALILREAESSTGLGHGVAVPHAQYAGVDRVRGVFLRMDAPLEFDALDEQPVDLIFVLLSPPDAEIEHLRALARVSRLLRNGEIREQLRQARSADAIYALLVQDAHASAA